MIFRLSRVRALIVYAHSNVSSSMYLIFLHWLVDLRQTSTYQCIKWFCQTHFPHLVFETDIFTQFEIIFMQYYPYSVLSLPLCWWLQCSFFRKQYLYIFNTLPRKNIARKISTLKSSRIVTSNYVELVVCDLKFILLQGVLGRIANCKTNTNNTNITLYRGSIIIERHRKSFRQKVEYFEKKGNCWP